MRVLKDWHLSVFIVLHKGDNSVLMWVQTYSRSTPSSFLTVLWRTHVLVAHHLGKASVFWWAFTGIWIFFLTKFSSASWLWIYKLWLLNSMCPSFLMKCFEVCVLRFITCVVFWNYSPHDIYWSLLFVLGKDQQRAWLIIPDVF